MDVAVIRVAAPVRQGVAQRDDTGRGVRCAHEEKGDEQGHGQGAPDPWPEGRTAYHYNNNT